MEQPPTSEVAVLANALRDRGLRTLTGVISDSGGVIRGKTVPSHRVADFATAGMGASPSWFVFTADGGIAFTDELNAVGDLRLTADLGTAVVLDDGFGWSAADTRDQDGELSPYCCRSAVRRQVDGLAERGIDVAVGHELEFVLFDDTGEQPAGARAWQPYGVGPHSELSRLLGDLCDRLGGAGVPVEQVHAEFGVGQFELSLPAADPLRAADDVLLARAVIGRTARAHGLRASFSPVPVAGGAGNGAHLHLSLHRGDTPLLSAGDGAEGLSTEAAHAVAGLVAGLPDTMAVLAGTVVSGQRMRPQNWAGAWACWGVENREAAVRLVREGRGNPRGAHLEVKCIDAGANTYLATALVLGLAARGIERRSSLPPAVLVDPSTLPAKEASRAQIVAMPNGPAERIQRWADSGAVRDILGPGLRGSVLAVRRHEAAAETGEVDWNAATRFAWSS